ncbi:MAG: DNA translocase FtsK 4TM domain-containing protein, partial [Candidatus Saccharibacteria bacterium]|nr:DNA translocase FtsK 4TM domain-containing protein [Candidatus Saccharibacteria bacterium]
MAKRGRKPAARGRSGARRKKSTREVKPQQELPGGFWNQVFAVIMIVMAIILVLTWFGSGGSLLEQISGGLYFLVGYAEYLVPVGLVYLAVKIFLSESNQIPTVLWVMTILMIFWVAGMTGLPALGETETAKMTGGVIGNWLNGIMTQILDPGVAALIYVVLIFLTGVFILQTSPAAVFRAIGQMFKGAEKEEDGKNARLAKKAERGGGKEVEVHLGDEETGAEPAIKKAPIKLNSPAAAPKVAAPSPSPERALVSVTDPNWKFPATDILEKKASPPDAGNHQQNALIIKSTLQDFGIDVEMESANVGPRVTQYTMKPSSGVNLSKIVARDKELALNLAVESVRIEAPIPGTRLVGVEIPNVKGADVRLRSILESPEWKNADDPLVFALGKDISGRAVVTSLAKMPHLLIAGTTGSGKSVMTNTMIISMLYRNAPSDLKLIIIDPKQVEMVQYSDIPHLLTPIINDTTQALSALKWAVAEMERRYKLLAD